MFYIKNSDGRTLLSFSVTIPQDFIIKNTYAWNQPKPDTPGAIFSVGTYAQVATANREARFDRFVESTGTSIVGLNLTATNNARVEFREKAAQYGATYARVYMYLDQCEIGKPVGVYLGNVLVIYIENITA